MKLNDFNLSTSSLNGQYVLWATSTQLTAPISALVHHENQLILMAGKQEAALTLDQFRTRVQRLNPQTQFYFNLPDYPLFGYRLVGSQLLFH